MKKNIVVGSMSAHKLDAVRKACELLSLDAAVSGVKTSSGQNEQPVGFEETFQGALTRAQGIRSPGDRSIAIGIESGILLSENVTLDIAVVVVLTYDSRIVTSSVGIQFPEGCNILAAQRGFKTTTVGSVVAEQLGGDPTDPHATITNGKITRSALLTDAIVAALSQL